MDRKIYNHIRERIVPFIISPAFRTYKVVKNKLSRILLETNFCVCTIFVFKNYGLAESHAKMPIVNYFNLSVEILIQRISSWTYDLICRERFHDRVPTRTGKPGKMGRHFPVREKSGNFEQTGKVRENHTKYWKLR